MGCVWLGAGVDDLADARYADRLARRTLQNLSSVAADLVWTAIGSRLRAGAAACIGSSSYFSLAHGANLGLLSMRTLKV